MIDLGSGRPTPVDLLDGLPRRVCPDPARAALVAERAGGAPLPFDLAAPRAGSPLEGRLGETRGPPTTRRTPPPWPRCTTPGASLSRRGLMVGEPDHGVVDEGLVGAVGLLATPDVALDLDVAVGMVHARAWHRQAGEAVAALSTVDGIVFELAWFPTSAWADELARVAVVPEDVVLRESRGAAGPRRALRARRRRRRGDAHLALRPGARAGGPALGAHHRRGRRARRRRRRQHRPGGADHRGPGPAAGAGRRRHRRRDQRGRRGVLDPARRRVAGAAAPPHRRRAARGGAQRGAARPRPPTWPPCWPRSSPR